MSTAVEGISSLELVNLERLAHILRGLSAPELETLELLVDDEALRGIRIGLHELDEGEGIPIDEW